MGNNFGAQTKKTGSRIFYALSVFLFAVASTVINFHAVNAASVKQVSTGAETACAVVEGVAKCWGEGGSGQLGNRSTSSSSSPVDVYAVKDPAPIRPNPCGGWFQPSCTPVAQPSSPLGDKTVSKVSVGKNHTCAVASAKVYCWGDNSRGQLGNRTNTSSTIPVTVDTQTQDVTPAPVKPNPCGGWFQPSCTPVAQPTKPKSALGGKEVVDIAVSEYYTCALASDGGVACWGEGDNGRLGTNSTTDVNYPKSVYVAPGSALDSKKGVKLAKAAGATMCVIAVPTASTSASAGDPYCWGYGIDDGRSLPANQRSTVACSSSSPTSKPSSATETTIFQSSKPVKVTSEALVALDGDNYITGLSTNGTAHYWGMYGYTGTTSASNVTTCTIKKCTSMAPTVRLAKSTEGDVEAKTEAQLARYNHGTGGNTSGGHNNQNSQGQNIGGNKGPSCTNSTHYGYTKSTIYDWTGKKAATTPPAWSSSQNGFTAVSGNVYNGLYCATTGVATSCDAHGTGSSAGQTGSGYTQKCTTSGFWPFTQTTCTPDPTGPQSVKSDDWMANKTIKQLSTGTSGYSCALTNDAMVGCWGVNSSGQLGDRTKVNKNVPTKVEL